MFLALLMLLTGGAVAVAVEKRKNKPGLQGASGQASESLAAVLTGKRPKQSRETRVKPVRVGVGHRGVSTPKDENARPDVADIRGRFTEKIERVTMQPSRNVNRPVVTKTAAELQSWSNARDLSSIDERKEFSDEERHDLEREESEFGSGS